MGLNDFAIKSVTYASLPTSVSISSPLAAIPRKFSSLVEVVFIFVIFLRGSQLILQKNLIELSVAIHSTSLPYQKFMKSLQNSNDVGWVNVDSIGRWSVLLIL